jgi:glycosyltransferase involved in cell wall biosynthesis
MKNRRVGICHQTVADGDAIGNDIAGMYDLLESMGWEPAILCEYVHGDLGSRRTVTVLDAETVNAHGLLIYHHSIYWERGEALLRAYTGVPVVKYHNITPPQFMEPYSSTNTLLCRAGREQTQRLIRLPGDHYWLADSEYNRRDLTALGERPDRIAVVPPFTHTDALLGRPSMAEYDGPGPRYALFVGRLMPHKGHLTLLKILRAYQTHVDGDLALYIVGAQDAELASYRAELDAFIQDFALRCRIYDHVEQGVLTELFRSCHVYLCMSAHEGFCVPIVEAQAAGMPVVAMDASAVRDTAGEGQLVGPPPLEDPDHLFYALLLQQLFADPDLRRALVRRGYRNVLTRFSREAVENAFMGALWPRLRPPR